MTSQIRASALFTVLFLLVSAIPTAARLPELVPTRWPIRTTRA